MSDSPGEFHRETGIDNRRDSYRGFFDADWANGFLDALRPTRLFEAGVDLTPNWKAVSNARMWPWLITEQWHSDLSDSLDAKTPFTTQKLELICQKLADHIESRGAKVSAVRGVLRDAVRDIDQQLTDSLLIASEESRVTRRALWEDLIQERAFHDAIWSSERKLLVSVHHV